MRREGGREGGREEQIGPALNAEDAKLLAQENFACSPIILNSPFSILNFSLSILNS
jgi:hypothetical protein